MLLSIIIPTHNNSKRLQVLINSLLKQTLSENLKIEILVVSNFLDRKLQTWLGSVKPHQFQIHWFCSDKLGVNTARNLGVKKAQGEWLLFLDDDCLIPDENHLRRLLSCLKNQKSVHAVGGGYMLQKPVTTGGLVYHKISQHWLFSEVSKGGLSKRLIGGNSCYRKEVFKAGFLFDENIVFGGAETELNERLVRAGYKFYLSNDLNIYHTGQLSIFGLIKKAYKQGVGFEYRWQKNQFRSCTPPLCEDGLTWRQRFFCLLYRYFFERGRQFKRRRYSFWQGKSAKSYELVTKLLALLALTGLLGSCVHQQVEPPGLVQFEERHRCIGRSQSNNYAVYLHGFTGSTFSGQEVENIQNLKKLAEALDMTIALPQSGVGCIRNGRSQRCWGTEMTKSQALQTLGTIKRAANKCFPKGRDYGLIGFSNGGYMATKIFAYCLAPQYEPDLKWIVTVGSAKLWGRGYSRTSLKNCRPIAIVAGKRDRYNYEIRQSKFRNLRKKGADISILLFDGGHELPFGPLITVMRKHIN